MKIPGQDDTVNVAKTFLAQNTFANDDRDPTSLQSRVVIPPKSYVNFMRSVEKRSVDFLCQRKDLLDQAQSWNELSLEDKTSHCAQVAELVYGCLDAEIQKKSFGFAQCAPPSRLDQVVNFTHPHYLPVLSDVVLEMASSVQSEIGKEGAILGDAKSQAFWNMYSSVECSCFDDSSPFERDAKLFAKKFVRNFSVCTGIEHVPDCVKLEDILGKEAAAAFVREILQLKL